MSPEPTPPIIASLEYNLDFNFLETLVSGTRGTHVPRHGKAVPIEELGNLRISDFSKSLSPSPFVFEGADTELEASQSTESIL